MGTMPLQNGGGGDNEVMCLEQYWEHGRSSTHMRPLQQLHSALLQAEVPGEPEWP